MTHRLTPRCAASHICLQSPCCLMAGRQSLSSHCYTYSPAAFSRSLVLLDKKRCICTGGCAHTLLNYSLRNTKIIQKQVIGWLYEILWDSFYWSAFILNSLRVVQFLLINNENNGFRWEFCQYFLFFFLLKKKKDKEK